MPELPLRVTFYGVRGSRPCPGEAFARYGGNTACVAVEMQGEAPILLDLGTGLVPFGAHQPLDGTFRAAALVTHAHWDHIQGLPYFAPINRPGAVLDVYGPGEGGMSLTEVFDRAIAAPMFPISWRDLAGTIRFHDVTAGDFSRGAVAVRAASVPHPGAMLGYRVEVAGVVVAYVSDHQMPADPSTVDPAVLSLCAGADLLIHDAQFTDEEFAGKPDWGHCTAEYAVEVARRCGARRLALFHHDPSHDDTFLDGLAKDVVVHASSVGVTAFAATEGLVVELGTGRG